ncbi:MAG: phosphoglycolate phosphatase [Nevskia sp.]|nr:phosphoglycolate phosphatase [Nevskia sp.]
MPSLSTTSPPPSAPFACRALIFDLDGTLADTAADIAVAVDRTLADLGAAAAGEARVRTWLGLGMKVLIERALCHAGLEMAVPVERAEALFVDHYGREFAVRTTLYPGVRDTLPQLAHCGLRLAVCTNKPRRFTLPLLQRLDIAALFEAVAAGDDFPTRKPDPAPLLNLAHQLDTSAAGCLLVGDSRTDVAAARAAGMPVVTVSYGYNEGEPIARSHPDAIIDDFRQLPALIV